MSKKAISDFTWSYTEEPHRSRRKEILAKHPEVKELFGVDPRSKYWVFLSVAIQFAAAWVLRDASWWVIVVVAYVLGATVNHSLNLAGHELAHNLFFDNPVHNTLFGFIANLPMPLATTVYVPYQAHLGEVAQWAAGAPALFASYEPPSPRVTPLVRPNRKNIALRTHSALTSAQKNAPGPSPIGSGRSLLRWWTSTAAPRAFIPLFAPFYHPHLPPKIPSMLDTNLLLV